MFFPQRVPLPPRVRITDLRVCEREKRERNKEISEICEYMKRKEKKRKEKKRKEKKRKGKEKKKKKKKRNDRINDK